jgi:hypothetical protein
VRGAHVLIFHYPQANLFTKKMANDEQETNQLMAKLPAPYRLPIFAIEPTKEQARGLLRERKHLALTTYRAIGPLTETVKTEKSMKSLMHALWRRFVDTTLSDDAIERLVAAHKSANGDLDRRDCWNVFLAALRYIVLNSSVRDLVRDGYVMLFVDSEAGNKQVDLAQITAKNNYVAVLRFR